MQEKGKFPSQPQPNPKEVHEITSANEPTLKMDKVKVVISLQSGQKVDRPVPKSLDASKEDKEEELEIIIIKDLFIIGLYYLSKTCSLKHISYTHF